jgi:hypothetical protein
MEVTIVALVLESIHTCIEDLGGPTLKIGDVTVVWVLT